MTLRLIAIDLDDRDLAHRVAGTLQEVVEPPPDAVTLFERAAASTGAPAGWRIEAYFAEDPDIGRLQSLLDSEAGTPLPPIVATAVAERNWVAISQAALPPVTAGRFTVYGGHDRARVAAGPNALLIEAGEAFGTAHHATTYGCLLAIDRLTQRQRFARVLDIGTGSGVLAIALARSLPNATITATDLDQRSVEVARDNMRQNKVGGRIRALRAAGFSVPALRRPAAFDLIVANILAEPLIGLAADVARALAPEGVVILSGLLAHQAPAVIAAYRPHGLRLETNNRIAGWSTLVLSRRGIAPATKRP
ncbi:MAG: 50S ribosomal protein L11 methyltransferase [Hyphomicrobium sp.]